MFVFYSGNGLIVWLTYAVVLNTLSLATSRMDSFKKKFALEVSSFVFENAT